MKMNMYSIWDRKAQTYNQLFCAPNDAVAMRQITQVCMDESTDLARTPEDFELHQLGMWETASGQIETPPEPLLVIHVDTLSLAALRAKMQAARQYDHIAKETDQ